jgi:hypothetical protein
MSLISEPCAHESTATYRQTQCRDCGAVEIGGNWVALPSGRIRELETELDQRRGTIDRLHEATGLAMSKAGEIIIERDQLQAKVSELHRIPWRQVVLRARRVLAILTTPEDQTISSRDFALAVEALRGAVDAYDANLELDENDDYGEMGRDELLARARDWRQVANDRSAEIIRLGMQREIVDAALRDTVAERDRLHALATNTATDARVLTKAIARTGENTVSGVVSALVESIYVRHEPFDVGEPEEEAADG